MRMHVDMMARLFGGSVSIKDAASYPRLRHGYVDHVDSSTSWCSAIHEEGGKDIAIDSICIEGTTAECGIAESEGTVPHDIIVGVQTAGRNIALAEMSSTTFNSCTSEESGVGESCSRVE